MRKRGGDYGTDRADRGSGGRCYGDIGGIRGSGCRRCETGGSGYRGDGKEGDPCQRPEGYRGLRQKLGGKENKRNFHQPDADRPFQKPLPAGPSAGVWPCKAGRRTGGGQSPYRPGGGEGDPAAGRRDRKEPEGWINFWIF